MIRVPSTTGVRKMIQWSVCIMHPFLHLQLGFDNHTNLSSQKHTPPCSANPSIARSVVTSVIQFLLAPISKNQAQMPSLRIRGLHRQIDPHLSTPIASGQSTPFCDFRAGAMCSMHIPPPTPRLLHESVSQSPSYNDSTRAARISS